MGLASRKAALGGDFTGRELAGAGGVHGKELSTIQALHMSS